MKHSRMSAIPSWLVAAATLTSGILLGVLLDRWLPIPMETALVEVWRPVTLLLQAATDTWWNSKAFYIPAIWLGAVTAQILGVPGSSGVTLPFLRRMFPNRDPSVYDRVDVFLTTTLAPAVIFVVCTPASAPLAFALGLGWGTVVQKILRWVEGLPNLDLGPRV
jgi:hypothetical protein